MVRLSDSHCHLDFPQFSGEVESLIARARTQGVHRMLTIATTYQGLSETQRISENHEGVYFAFGIHPLHVHEAELITVEYLIQTARHKKMIAIGETGLDYYYSTEHKIAQQESLDIHITAAQETGLPLIIHARGADADMEAILTSRYKQRAFSCVMHCYSSGAQLAQAALDCGFYLSMSGVITFKNAQAVRDVFNKTPIDRVLIETDAPYLAPVPYRGARNEPSFVAKTAVFGAELYGLSLLDFAHQTERNFERLFAKVQTDEGDHER